jgi:hypothetical protein
LLLSPLMPATQAELRDELQKEAFLLRTLRDDAVCHLHRGGVDAEREWQRLEPLVSAALARAESEESDESCLTITRAATAMRTLCATLR